ncbi:hypothetical protein ELH75_26090 (plasmid) [Rhizobium leguminosarum]|nr:hypothetical protein ELH75_26090 [Rhizobium leguminosarum]TBY26058.1 hypothetical protein E0H30_00445 [Rhizobium leguminosarum bv. viciae]TBY32817.1 hypothetical protein E0H37_04875 [Rhizobium leguminosarum bv. viciae]TBZ04674.1 hypothetical protein E0H49_05765 [Rhizobium leguminosarum bv. viciae]
MRINLDHQASEAGCRQAGARPSRTISISGGGGFVGERRLGVPEHFRFLSSHGNALFCFYAIPDAKTLRTFAGNCFSRSRGQHAALLGGPGCDVVHKARV